MRYAVSHIQTFKMRLAPTEAQKYRLNQYIGAARKMQNLLLDTVQKQYEAWVLADKPKELRPNVSHIGLTYLVTIIKLEYKVRWSGVCTLLVADKWYPSTQLCSCCGKKASTKLTLTVREWICEHCGAEHNRDFNASQNLNALAFKYMSRKNQYKGQIILTGRFAM